jgi:hypothetical protein
MGRRLIYDAEKRLVEVKKNNVCIATFVYDDKRVCDGH